MESKHLEFTMVKDTGKTKIYHVVSKTDATIVGLIHWDGAWRQYIYDQNANVKMSHDCLADLSNFIKMLMMERKK